MTEFLAGMAVAGLIGLFLWLRRPRGGLPSRGRSQVYVSIEEIRSVGELVVYKVKAKEIVTTAEHWLGETGQRYFRWLISAKKMAMIFEFDIEFKFNLKSRDFSIENLGNGRFELKMPPCYYDIKIVDINFYDEQNSKLLPWLLPDLINRALGTGFDEQEKNRLKDEARTQASAMSRRLAASMWTDIQRSCENTLAALAKGFGARDVTLNFDQSQLTQTGVETDLPLKKSKQGNHRCFPAECRKRMFDRMKYGDEKAAGKRPAPPFILPNLPNGRSSTLWNAFHAESFLSSTPDSRRTRWLISTD